METCLKGIAEHFPLTEKELRGYSSLGLAYIGDCIFELFVRTMVVTKGNDKANHYHQKTIGYVNAAAQTEMMEIIKPLLTDEEKAQTCKAVFLYEIRLRNLCSQNIAWHR